ncbi:DUF3142 domain-containing protein [Serratia quinivorans]|uniref:DUF3142 domain-containing protein n=1 Tax=Serratia quinivorans TaxID=137545 RepID=UPI0021780546|nr:DUF3142 domain-containing protein [Serratia quinivorans]CAI1123831.1 Protein of uncharacterised function (DUF3142) [Serratia quinivorans]CAI1150265.1 Protein of uncharacterised function (DUF3142) [Serratia quinivorans]CAI1833566.1 Protein of uncharacterised function (DUF3142) [Serratia quinivorans]CAI2139577.1 Protein of uncharacterised function (DUF3142) [Serratia quinivorans]CAI2150755.1 Protein of uncharacterised function (DUF3142) [Serratia quinivorans]
MKRGLMALLLLVLAFIAWFGGRQQALQLPQTWDNQVYVWQRVWTPQHAAALAQSRDLFSALRVLGLQVHPREGWREIPVNLSLLKQDGRPLWLVVRLDGQLAQLDESAIRQRLLKQVQQWQAAGLQVIGVEIDHDAATARLHDYQHFLQQLRQQLPRSLQLGITALPTWIDSAALPGVLQQVDSSVLQVHAVLSPQQGLFSGPLALRWVKQYAKMTQRPFRVALPAYGMGLVGFDAQGAQVESEAPLRVAGTTRELTVAPQQVADFLHQLNAQTTPHLRGIIWFRLPLADDRRAWSLTTLRAVIENQPLSVNWQIKISHQPQQKGLNDLILHNNGPIDAPLPHEIVFTASDCLAADAAGNYRLESEPQRQRFVLINGDQLRAGQSRPLGWLRCQQLMPGGTLVTP